MKKENRKIIFLLCIFAGALPLIVRAADGGDTYTRITPNEVAQSWVDKGLEIAKISPNSDREAECYRRALKANPNHGSAHFNLAFALDSQAIHKWRDSDTTWQALDKFYEALAHYAETVRIVPDRKDAYTNAIRIAKLLFKTPTRRPPDLHLIRVHLRTCQEALKTKKKTSSWPFEQNLDKLIFGIEKRIMELKAFNPYDELVPAKNIAKILDRRFTRGQSPYQGPRMPLMIQFDLNKASISQYSSAQLREMAKALKSEKLADIKILIEGHACSLGTLEHNMQLSQRRAQSVKNYLVEKFGLLENRFNIRAYGETWPLVTNETEKKRAMNRRVEFVNIRELDRHIELISHQKRSKDVDIFDLLY